LVDSVGQASGIEVALIIGGDGMAIVIALADEFNRGFEGKSIRAGDFEAEFAGVALGVERKSEERESEDEDAEVE